MSDNNKEAKDVLRGAAKILAQQTEEDHEIVVAMTIDGTRENMVIGNATNSMLVSLIHTICMGAETRLKMCNCVACEHATKMLVEFREKAEQELSDEGWNMKKERMH